MSFLLNLLSTYTLTVSLTAAQISALRETPVQLLAAPGILTTSVPTQVVVQFTGNGTGYTPGDQFVVYYGTTQPSSSNGVVCTPFTPFTDMASFLISGTSCVISSPANVMRSTSTTNKALFLSLLSDASSNWTGGNGTVSISLVVNNVSTTL
jgi:hypothetical protein